MQTIRQLLHVGLVLVMFLMMVGCVELSRVEKNYGTAYHRMRSQQILSFESEKKEEPVEGLEGIIVQKIIQRYGETFDKPPPPPTFTLSIGAVGGAGK